LLLDGQPNSSVEADVVPLFPAATDVKQLALRRAPAIPAISFIFEFGTTLPSLSASCRQSESLTDDVHALRGIISMSTAS
jgi:hypothetical protein